MNGYSRIQTNGIKQHQFTFIPGLFLQTIKIVQLGAFFSDKNLYIINSQKEIFQYKWNVGLHLIKLKHDLKKFTSLYENIDGELLPSSMSEHSC